MAFWNDVKKSLVDPVVSSTENLLKGNVSTAVKQSADPYINYQKFISGGNQLDKMKKAQKEKQAAGAAAAQAEAQATADAYNAERAKPRGALESIMGTTVPGVTAAALDPRFRDSQLQLLDQLTRQSQGQGPSLAQMQFKQAGNTALQKAMGAIRAASGTNAALGGRTAALASTNLLGNIAAESGMARLKEQQDAQSALAALAGAGRTGDLQARQQDIGLGASNAEIALKNLAVQQSAAGGLLDETGRRFEGHYNRGAQVAAAAGGKRGGGGDGVLPAVLGAGGAILGGIYGGPAGAAAGGTVGKAAGDQMSLVGRPAAVKDTQAPPRGTSLRSGPFMKLRR